MCFILILGELNSIIKMPIGTCTDIPFSVSTYLEASILPVLAKLCLDILRWTAVWTECCNLNIFSSGSKFMMIVMCLLLEPFKSYFKNF